MVKASDKKETKAKTNSKAENKTKAEAVSKAKSTSKVKSDKNTTNKWGFLAPTREKAKEMEAKYGVHFTPLIDYMKVIFPDIDDWEENTYFPWGCFDYGISEQDLETFYDGENQNIDLSDNSGELYVKIDLYSASEHKSVINSHGVRLYKYNNDTGNFYPDSTRIKACDARECTGGECYTINSYVQLTNTTVKQIFGVDVKEPLFDENTPTITQPWVNGFNREKSVESILKGIYDGDEKQYQVNLEAYHAYRTLYDNIGLSKIIVEKLFGLYDYEIDLNTDEKISILIGPNGCGKTTILKIVRFMLSGEGNIEEILKIPFKSVTSVLANGKKLKLEPTENGLITYIDDQRVADFGNDRTTYKDYQDIYKSRLKDYHCHFNTEFISAQRLLGEIDGEKIDEKNVHKYFDTISQIRENFTHFCKTTEKEYNELKSAAEHSLFYAYIEKESEILKNNIFEEKWREFSEKRFKYEYCKALSPILEWAEVWMVVLSRDKNDTVEIIRRYKNSSKDKKQFLCLYLDKFNKTLDPIEEFYKKTMLFQRIINDRFNITKKQLKYRFGEIYLTIGEGKDEKEISLDVLSSGEKNDFIMFYNLIFNCNDCKIFIDEPEISLHIEWQERYIDDLSEICEMNNIQALVATHSPNIIYDHTDLIANWEIKDE